MMGAVSVEHASGKGSADENFPVGSLLIAKRLRPHVMAYYRFARNADDVGDAPDLSSEEKLRRLDRMGAVLEGAAGDDAPSATAMRQSLAETGLSAAHCHDLLDAFRQDAVKSRYANWQELLDYCRLSAAPVGRYLLDLHGESRDTWKASDALCAALQVINHLQDCGKDYHEIDRVYLAQDWMSEEGASVEDLAKPASTPGLRRVLDRMVAATWPLIEEARNLPGGVKDRGLRAESAIIISCADKLLTALGRQDPLAKRVKLGAGDIALSVAGGLLRQGLSW
jgi:farnesyl-diphosphate farnesyltransferase